MLLFNYGSVHKRKTEYFLYEHRNVQEGGGGGDVCFWFLSTRNHFNTQHVTKRESKLLLIMIPNKAMQQASILLTSNFSIKSPHQTVTHYQGEAGQDLLR